MNYQYHYNRLITSRASMNNFSCAYHEKHHILPKSMGGSDEPYNIVSLTAREHFVAHWLLWRIYRNRKTACAFMYMCNILKKKGIKISSRTYGESREALSVTKISDTTRKRMRDYQSNRSKIHRERKITANIRLHKYKLIGMYNRTHSDSTRKLMSDKKLGNSNARGYKFTPEQSDNLSKSLLGKKKGKRLPSYQVQAIKDANYNKWLHKYGKEEADRRRKYHDERNTALKNRQITHD